MFFFSFVHGGGRLYYTPFALIFSNFILSLALILLCLASFFLFQSIFAWVYALQEWKWQGKRLWRACFAPINKEDMEVFVDRDFDTLNTRLEVEMYFPTSQWACNISIIFSIIIVIIEMLQTHWDVGHPLYASSIWNRIRSLVHKMEPSLLEGESPTDFKVI